MEAREFGERILWGCVRLKRPTRRQMQNIKARWARLQAEGLTEGIIDLTALPDETQGYIRIEDEVMPRKQEAKSQERG